MPSPRAPPEEIGWGLAGRKINGRGRARLIRGVLCSSKRQSFTGNREMQMADQEGLELGEFIYGRHGMPEFLLDCSSLAKSADSHMQTRIKI